MRALIVEDEPLIAMDGQAILEELGFGDIAVCMNLRSAKSLLEKSRGDQAPGFDFALLDINLGGGDTSLELAETLIEDGVPVVFATGYNPSERLVDHLDAPLVNKPFTDQAIKSVVRKVFAQNA